MLPVTYCLFVPNNNRLDGVALGTAFVDGYSEKSVYRISMLHTSVYIRYLEKTKKQE